MQFLKRIHAFTLIETLVVIGITAMLSVIILGYNRSTDTTLALYRDQAVVIAALNRAKAFAIEKFNSPDACAYGVHFEKDSREFRIFKDLNVNTGSGADCRIAGVYQGNKQYDGLGEAVDAPLERDTRFKWILTDGSGASVSSLDVLFIPPDPITTSTVDLPVTIGLQGGGSVEVIVSQGGQITGK